MVAKLILVVDDSATMRLSLKTQLELQDFRVATAADGVQALEYLAGGTRPDLIITDVHMPNMDGLELIRRVRQAAGLRFVPILVLTTESQQTLRDEARRIGATGWLVKPVPGDELLRVVRHVVPGL
jgi:two-component system chemotaxis response regulator CheY